MLIYSFQETAVMLVAAIVIDWLIGDPAWPTHPVIYVGRLIRWLEKRLSKRNTSVQIAASAKIEKLNGIALTLITITVSCALMWAVLWICRYMHPWLGYAVNTWFISTTIAIKGLKDAAMQVYKPLQEGRLAEARKYAGYIVGRDTAVLNDQETVRATVETVAENIVDAVVSPLFYALLGGAPMAIMYRASNTLDSMVGYKNEKYYDLGWASARWDDLLNWLPARITGLLLVIAASIVPSMSSVRTWKSIRAYAHYHPSPNSGIPEAAAAGAIGIELGGRNYYGGVASERARMGWPLRKLVHQDIRAAIKLLYGVSYLLAGGLLCALLVLWL